MLGLILVYHYKLFSPLVEQLAVLSGDLMRLESFVRISLLNSNVIKYMKKLLHNSFNSDVYLLFIVIYHYILLFTKFLQIYFFICVYIYQINSIYIFKNKKENKYILNANILLLN